MPHSRRSGLFGHVSVWHVGCSSNHSCVVDRVVCCWPCRVGPQLLRSLRLRARTRPPIECSSLRALPARPLRLHRAPRLRRFRTPVSRRRSRWRRRLPLSRPSLPTSTWCALPNSVTASIARSTWTFLRRLAQQPARARWAARRPWLALAEASFVEARERSP